MVKAATAKRRSAKRSIVNAIMLELLAGDPADAKIAKICKT